MGEIAKEFMGAQPKTPDAAYASVAYNNNPISIVPSKNYVLFAVGNDGYGSQYYSCAKIFNGSLVKLDNAGGTVNWSLSGNYVYASFAGDCVFAYAIEIK